MMRIDWSKRILGHPGNSRAMIALIAAISIACSVVFTPFQALAYSFGTVSVEGTVNVDPATVASYAGIANSTEVTDADLNAAYQRVLGSGLFSSVEVIPQGSTLLIRVTEFPTINLISFEGNQRLKDDALAALLGSTERRVYSPAQAEADAALIAEAYRGSARYSATVTPRIIRLDGNRVNLVFEITEGRVTEIERLSFVGNRAFSDYRLRQILETKQAGLLRQLIQRDSFIPERLDFDKRALTDFYLSRGYVDFQVLNATSQIARERNGFFVTFTVREGQPYTFGQITTVSEVPEADAAEFQAEIKLRPGVTYSPTLIDNTIQRLEALALKKGFNFVRIEPRVTRDDRNLKLNVAFALVRGERIFVERIDIEGNATTLDQVVRRQFNTVEGDPFNPREILQSAERIRALGYFETAEVNASPGSSADQVVVDVNVVEQPTGTLSFGATYGVSNGLGFNLGFSETNFLGRGQTFAVNVDTASASSNSQITFIEPAFLGRDLEFRFNTYYRTSNDDNAFYDTRFIGFTPSIKFPISVSSRLELRYQLSEDSISNVDLGTKDRPGTPRNDKTTGSSSVLRLEEGALLSSSLGYSLSYDSRRVGLNPNGGVILQFGQDFSGVGGDTHYILSTALLAAETRIFNESVTLRAELEGGAVTSLSGNSRVTERFFLNGKIRGFEPNGIGPRDLQVDNQDALGGNLFAVARFEANFPLGLPEEYGITGGLFLDAGSVWSLDNANGGPNGGRPVDDSLHLRSAIGVSLFINTPVGPLRLNFSKALAKQDYDREQSFDLTVSTKF